MIDYLASLPHYADHLAPIWGETGGGRFDGDLYRLDDNGAPVVIAGHQDLALVPGSRRVAFVDHGAGQTYQNLDHGAYAGGRDRERIELFLCPSERVAALNRARYPNARVEVVGSPRLDSLAAEARVGVLDSTHRSTVALTWHWEPTVMPEALSAWPYYRDVIERLVATRDDVEWLGHAHPRMLERVAPWYQSLGVPVVVDFREVVRRADLLVFDNTSAGYEAAALDVPTLALDAPMYRPEQDHGLRFWDLVPGLRLMARIDGRPECGIVHANWGRDHLTYAIDEALDDRLELATLRRSVSEIVYPVRGDAAERAAAVLTDWAS